MEGVSSALHLICDKIEHLSISTKREKSCVFINNFNLFTSLKKIPDKKLDYQKLKEILSEGRDTDIRFYHNGSEESTKFFDFLEENLNYQIIPVKFSEIDFEITYDMVNLANKNYYDSFILLANSESYVRLIRRLKMEFGITCDAAFLGSTMLQKVANRFWDLSIFSTLFKERNDAGFVKEEQRVYYN